MFTKDFLKQIEAAAFGPFFHEEIRSIFQQDTADGKYGNEEKEYLAAMKVLQKKLSEEKLVLLGEYEAICQKIREFSAQHGFIAGIYCGFKQLFTEDDALDGGFDKYVVEEIAWKPRMERHAANYANIEKRNEIYGQIETNEPKAIGKKMVIVSCYWSQAAHSASLNAFYCGYRAALSIKDYIAPFEGNYMARIRKELAMEHHLGYIESYSEIERRREREQAAAKQIHPESAAVPV